MVCVCKQPGRAHTSRREQKRSEASARSRSPDPLSCFGPAQWTSDSQHCAAAAARSKHSSCLACFWVSIACLLADRGAADDSLSSSAKDDPIALPGIFMIDDTHAHAPLPDRCLPVNPQIPTQEEAEGAMLGGWRQDAGPSDSIHLPFARGRAGRSQQPQQSSQHGQQQHGRRHHSEGPDFDLDPSSVVEVSESNAPASKHALYPPPLMTIHLPSSSSSHLQKAHRHATAAEEARRAGRLAEALQEHVEASRCFLEAADRLSDVNGVVRMR